MNTIQYMKSIFQLNEEEEKHYLEILEQFVGSQLERGNTK